MPSSSLSRMRTSNHHCLSVSSIKFVESFAAFSSLCFLKQNVENPYTSVRNRNNQHIYSFSTVIFLFDSCGHPYAVTRTQIGISIKCCCRLHKWCICVCVCLSKFYSFQKHSKIQKNWIVFLFSTRLYFPYGKRIRAFSMYRQQQRQ